MSHIRDLAAEEQGTPGQIGALMPGAPGAAALAPAAHMSPMAAMLGRAERQVGWLLPMTSVAPAGEWAMVESGAVGSACPPEHAGGRMAKGPILPRG